MFVICCGRQNIAPVDRRRRPKVTADAINGRYCLLVNDSKKIKSITSTIYTVLGVLFCWCTAKLRSLCRVLYKLCGLCAFVVFSLLCRFHSSHNFIKLLQCFFSSKVISAYIISNRQSVRSYKTNTLRLDRSVFIQCNYIKSGLGNVNCYTTVIVIV